MDTKRDGEAFSPVSLALKGMLIGGANTIPGVSGGTIAVIVGVYDRLIHAVGSFRRGEGGWKANLRFLVPVGVGVVVGILVFAWIIDFFLTRAPSQTSLFFVGLIVGSLPFVVRQVGDTRFRPVYLIPAIVAFAVVVVLAVVSAPDVAAEPITTLTAATAAQLVGAGAIAAATMIIPGVSGSFVLLLLGLYSTVVRAAKDINLPILLVLIAGALVGMVVIVKLLQFLLDRAHAPTYYAIIGLIVGSLVALWPPIDSWFVGLTGVAAAAAGFAAAILLGGRGKRPEPDPV